MPTRQTSAVCLGARSCWTDPRTRWLCRLDHCHRMGGCSWSMRIALQPVATAACGETPGLVVTERRCRESSPAPGPRELSPGARLGDRVIDNRGAVPT